MVGLQEELLCRKGKVTYISAFLFFLLNISAVVLIKEKERREGLIFLHSEAMSAHILSGY